MTQNYHNPWESLEQQTETELMVFSGIPKFFWSMGPDRKYRVVLEYDKDSIGDLNLPNHSGISVMTYEDSGEYSLIHYLIFELKDSANREIFRILMTNIMQETEEEEDPNLAVHTALAKLDDWAQVLRRSRSRKLTRDEQKGLIAELLFMQRVLAKQISPPSDMLTCWTGPTGSPKDFGIGNIAVEVKARRGTSASYVNISSEHQLDDAGLENLYLCVTNINDAMQGVPEGFTLNDSVARMYDLFHDNIPAQHALTELLDSYPDGRGGFSFEDEYKDLFTYNGESYYLVGDGFPRITALANSGISRVRYNIHLAECEDFKTDEDSITNYLANLELRKTEEEGE